MNLKVPGTILPLGCAILSTRAKTVRGVGKAIFFFFILMSLNIHAESKSWQWKFEV